MIIPKTSLPQPSDKNDLRRLYDLSKTTRDTSLPYSTATIKRYMRDYYFVELVWVHAYKEGRYPGYKRKFNLVDINTGAVLKARVTLDHIRYFLTRKGFPCPPPPRHSGAVNFLKAVEEIRKECENNSKTQLTFWD